MLSKPLSVNAWPQRRSEVSGRGCSTILSAHRRPAVKVNLWNIHNPGAPSLFSMEVALLTIDLHIPYAHSLKEKREVVCQLKDRLRAKFNVSVAEVDFNDMWQRARIAVVTVNADHVFLDKMISAIEREVEHILAGNSFEFRVEFL